MGETLSCSATAYKMVRDYANSKELSMREALNEIITNYFNAEARTMDATELSAIKEEMTNPANKSESQKPQPDPTPPTTMPTQSSKFTPLSMEELKERYTNKLEDEQIEACRCRTCNQYYDPNDIIEHELGHKSNN